MQHVQHSTGAVQRTGDIESDIMCPSSASPDCVDPPCGPEEHIVLLARLAETGETLCVSLQPGLVYGFSLGAPTGPPRIAFSVDGMHVTGDYDWVWIDGAAWASLSLRAEDVTCTMRVARAEQGEPPPGGVLEITGATKETHALVPGSIRHDLPLA
ncbi:hypothetical protein [Roseovarius sp. THAF27]|uniref:hypothetical protein n=1 Tax=Roseovarius sp. THAF27 TaxID=2587850 RepID=UPI001268A5DA|nr:hypothetical protein [Roseovarius sp. THAF27]